MNSTFCVDRTSQPGCNSYTWYYSVVRVLAISWIVVWVQGCTTTLVRVNSIPPGATVHYDYEPKGVTPTEFEVDWYGKHRLTLDHPDYGQRVQNITLNHPVHMTFPFDLLDAMKPFRTTDVHEFTVDFTEETPDGPEGANNGSTTDTQDEHTSR